MVTVILLVLGIFFLSIGAAMLGCGHSEGCGYKAYPWRWQYVSATVCLVGFVLIVISQIRA